MSKLYWTENGHIVPTLCEELTRFRRARKVLKLPATGAPANLYVLARAYPGSDRPLRLAANGVEVAALAPQALDGYLWYRVALEPDWLLAGQNQFEFWTDGSAMDGWSLGLEAGHCQPESWISDDGGTSWRNEKMGYLNVVRGEYLVRVRLDEGHDPPPPPVVWEDPANPRLESLRQKLPAVALGTGPQLEQVRALTGWLSTGWEHTGSSLGCVYAPWDAETILAWGGQKAGHDGRRPVAMCVHYAAAFVSCSQAIGIPARCAIVWDEPNGFRGHFVAEVWLDEFGKWAMVDPNLDAIFWRDGAPLSLPEIQEASDGLADLVEWGPGIAFQRQNPRIAPWLEETYLSGVCFRHRSTWWRADLLTQPEFSPPGHGSTSYCETGLVWEQRDLERGLGMFPFFGDARYFQGPPAPFKESRECTHPVR